MTSRQYAEVIGDPIGQSLSPTIHSFWLEALGIEADYGRKQVTRSGLKAYLGQARADENWRGCNVTMPLKLDALTLADEASDRALGTGAANIIVPRNGKLLAGNTDVGAVAKLIEQMARSGAPMRAVTLLGSGGGARAVLTALHLIGFRQVRIQSRNVGEAVALAVQHGLEVEPAPFDAPIEGDGLINATPLGMTGQLPLDVNLSAMTANGWVIDLITSPNPTDLVRSARARGMTAVGGIGMLIEQAAESFKLLFGKEPPRDKDAELLQKLGA
ncbi:MAG TPA: shikimate dehydrogenase [Sphingomicrobium sp.]|nr:shikimate dehydrogenase [Sphingomicrobium sp.]